MIKLYYVEQSQEGNMGDRNNNEIQKLVETHMDNVEKAARRYYRLLSDKSRSVVRIDDLLSAGYEGLISAANNYSSEKGVSFKTYAYKWINNAIVREIYFFTGEQAIHFDEQVENQLEASDNTVEDTALKGAELSDDEQALVIRKKLKEYHLSDEEIVVFMALKGIGREKVTNLTRLAKEIGKREIYVRRINQSAEEKIKAALNGGA